MRGTFHLVSEMETYGMQPKQTLEEMRNGSQQG